jgi:hypothetical protein
VAHHPAGVDGNALVHPNPNDKIQIPDECQMTEVQTSLIELWIAFGIGALTFELA